MKNHDHMVPDVRPPSDVSAAVGLVGLIGLIVWVMFCRNWPIINRLLNLGGPDVPLDGPYAALLALVVSGLPMAIWSLAVDKVHRRPSTGIDWTQPRHLADSIEISATKLAGLWATWVLIGCLYGVARWCWQGPWLFAMQVLSACIIPAVVLSVPYVLWLDRVLIEPRDAVWHFGAWLTGRKAYDSQEVWRHLRTWGVKGFFIAFMLSILPGGFAGVVNFGWSAAGADPVALTNGLINGLFMIDVQIGMVGYVMTLRPLDAHIRSADPWVGGWVAALICYPPFVLMGQGGPLDYHLNTADWAYWLADWPMLMWLWGGWLVLLTTVYAWATVAFGIRFSNLTWRGVLTNGPYRFTRHPAYLSKNLFWWSVTMPFLVTSDSVLDAARNTAVLALVSAVYYWRAKSEERHLIHEDIKYRAYSIWMEKHGLVTRCLKI